MEALSVSTFRLRENIWATLPQQRWGRWPDDRHLFPDQESSTCGSTYLPITRFWFLPAADWLCLKMLRFKCPYFSSVHVIVVVAKGMLYVQMGGEEVWAIEVWTVEIVISNMLRNLCSRSVDKLSKADVFNEEDTAVQMSCWKTPKSFSEEHICYKLAVSKINLKNEWTRLTSPNDGWSFSRAGSFSLL